MASVHKLHLKTASGDIKTAWVVDYADSRGNRRHQHYLAQRRQTCNPDRARCRQAPIGRMQTKLPSKSMRKFP
jgi:hypothetical protein